MAIEEYSKELASLINSGKIRDRQQLNAFKSRLAEKHNLSEMPTNPTIMRYAGKKNEKLQSLLSKKPVRSLSGINIIAIMAKPHKCPGNCIYCPGTHVDSEMPKSYTGKEPASMRALQTGFDPAKQVKDRLRQLTETGHKPEKIELIIMGGTFPATTLGYQKSFVKKAIDAVTAKKSKNLAEAKKNAELSERRITGITFETRPDFCKKKQVNRMLSFGGTRCELGVQILNDRVYKAVKRGHSVEDVTQATSFLKDAGFKVCYHCMPGLPSASLKDDFDSFKKMFYDKRFKPDNIKIYPCLVLKDTEIFRMYSKGKYSPLDTEQAVKTVSEIKALVPRWVRIMRVQRDIPSPLVEAGVKKSNLRQLVQEHMLRKGKNCNCIRCREAALNNAETDFENIEKRLFIDKYEASNGTEFFLSVEDLSKKLLFSYCRLRIPENSFRKEISDKSAIIRELRVLGKPVSLGRKNQKLFQHKGSGAALLKEAEKIALESFGRKEMVIIAGIGTREYYKKLGYKEKGPYMHKKLK